MNAAVVTEQRRSQSPDGDQELIRRIQHLALRAERTAHNHSNFVGPPPSQEHLDILAELRALTEVFLGRPQLPRQAEPAGDSRFVSGGAPS